MIELLAAPATALALAIGLWINQRVRGWLPDDPPRPGRKQHGRPVPLAGIVLWPVTAGACLWFGQPWLAAATTIAALTGYLDDRGKERGRDLDWRVKALLLAAAAALAVWPSGDPSPDWMRLAAIAAFVFVLTNATNFLDNTDGVCCVLSAVTLLAASGGSGPGAAAGAAALGFLPFNWPVARAFLGDAGAYILGLLAGALVARGLPGDPRALLLAGVQIVDFTQVVVARVVLGVAPWIGDRRHLTHVLQNAGLPRVLVAPVFGAVAVALAVLATTLV